MASGEDWDAQKMLELYMHDYLVKRNMHKTAEIFSQEADVCNNNPVVIDSPEGFLHEWWSIFYDVYASRQRKQQESKVESSVKAAQLTENQLQNICPIVPQVVMNQKRPGQFPISIDCDKMFGHPAACLLAAKNYEEEGFRQLVRGLDPNSWLRDVNKLNLSKSASTSSSHLQQQLCNQVQQRVVRENRLGISLGRAIPMDPTLYGVQKALLPITGPHDSGMNNGVNTMQLNGWSLNALNSVLQASNHQQQFQMLTAQHQPELLAEVRSQTPGNLTSTYPGSSANFDSPKVMLPKSNLGGKDAQMTVQLKQAVEHQYQHDRLQQQQLLENSRKKKKLSHSKAGDKNLDCKNVEDDKPVDENVESLLSHDDDDVDGTSSPFSILRRRSTSCNKKEHKGFTFEEVGCLHSSKSKVLCCHFSTDGKLLASAGHEKKVFIWNMDNFDFVTTSEGHSLLVTDVRFRPSSTLFATSSFDRTVQMWDAGRPSKSLFKLVGHAEQVMSLDFHPRKVDLLCSCDNNDEIRLWNVNEGTCIRASKGATKQVRFQPRVGRLLATATGNCINVIDVETDRLRYCLKGHAKEVLSICWDTSGKYIASVSEDSARVWSAASGGECIHELYSNGNNFQSCTFHPGYSLLLIIGGYQSLELWIPTESSKTWKVQAHNGLITSLADSLQTEMVASASHDQCVKLWK